MCVCVCVCVYWFGSVFVNIILNTAAFDGI